MDEKGPLGQSPTNEFGRKAERREGDWDTGMNGWDTQPGTEVGNPLSTGVSYSSRVSCSSDNDARICCGATVATPAVASPTAAA